MEKAFDNLVRDRRRWLGLILIVFVSGSAWTLLSRLPAMATTGEVPPSSPRQGFSAPGFSLDLLGGGQNRLCDCI